MALVADYGTSSEGEDFDEEETPLGTSSISTKPAQLQPSSGCSVTPITSSLPSVFDEDEEDSEEEEEESGTLSKFLPKPKAPNARVEDESFEEIGPIPPKKTYGDEAEPSQTTSTYHNIKSQKVRGGPIRITAPSLKDFEDDEETEGTTSRRFIQPSKKGSGLFAILPEPKGGFASSSETSFLKKTSQPSASSSTSSAIASSASMTVTPAGGISSSSSTPSKPYKMSNSLIPDAVKQRLAGKRPAPTKLDEIRNKYLKQEANVKIVSRKKPGDAAKSKDSDDSDEEESVDFFSLDKSDMNDIDPEALEKLKLPPPDFSKKVAAEAQSWAERPEDGEEELIAPSSSQASQDDLMKLVRNKKKGKGGSEINFIDVNADDLRPDSTEWLKTITDESAVPARRGKGLGGVQKRKHQITYLAFEAKAREQELQSQWAQNRATRRQTQMKYGF